MGFNKTLIGIGIFIFCRIKSKHLTLHVVINPYAKVYRMTFEYLRNCTLMGATLTPPISVICKVKWVHFAGKRTCLGSTSDEHDTHKTHLL